MVLSSSSYPIWVNEDDSNPSDDDVEHGAKMTLGVK